MTTEDAQTARIRELAEDAQTARIKELETRLVKAEEILIAVVDVLDEVEAVPLSALSKITKEARYFIAAKEGE